MNAGSTRWRRMDMPASPQRVWAAMQAARG
jgi:hypothetical protein